ncbi:MAG: hypothetical protein VX938_07955, partial [Myxococcota bacterium]|nr:hypothetical protein [Myxococcota bacterium]
MKRLGWIGLLSLLLVGCSTQEEGPTGGSDVVVFADTGETSEGPQVVITGPEDGSMVQMGALVTFTATVTDDRDEPSALALVWTSDLVGKLADGQVSPTGVVTNDIVLSQSGIQLITLTATDSHGNEGLASVSVVVNGPPKAPVVQISPDLPGTSDDLTVTIVEDAVDPNRGPEDLTYDYQWFRDGEEVEEQSGPLLPSTVTVRGELWQVRVSAFDGFGYGEPGSDQVTIVNTAPICGQAAMLPSSVTAETTFVCECLEREDADVGDPSSDTCVFYDGEVIVAQVEAGDEGCVLDAAEVDRGMELTCAYTPDDGQDSGEEVSSAPVVVMNALPSAPGVVLAPEVGQVGTLFTCEVTEPSVDGDGDDLSYETTWVLNGYPNPGTSNASVLGEQLISDADGTAAKGGDDLRCEVRANDGLDVSSPGVSALVILGNTPPEGGSVVVLPGEVQEGGSLNCEASGATDADGQDISWSYLWKVNDQVVEGED